MASVTERATSVFPSGLKGVSGDAGGIGGVGCCGTRLGWSPDDCRWPSAGWGDGVARDGSTESPGAGRGMERVGVRTSFAV